MWVAEGIGMTTYGYGGRKKSRGGPGDQNPQNKNQAERHARRLKFCMWVAEGMGMTICGCVWRKKSRGPKIKIQPNDMLGG